MNLVILLTLQWALLTFLSPFHQPPSHSSSKFLNNLLFVLHLPGLEMFSCCSVALDLLYFFIPPVKPMPRTWVSAIGSLTASLIPPSIPFVLLPVSTTWGVLKHNAEYRMSFLWSYRNRWKFFSWAFKAFHVKNKIYFSRPEQPHCYFSNCPLFLIHVTLSLLTLTQCSFSLKMSFPLQLFFHLVTFKS